jgi:hypothetical protein
MRAVRDRNRIFIEPANRAIWRKRGGNWARWPGNRSNNKRGLYANETAIFAR